jgi:hypothetical protein
VVVLKLSLFFLATSSLHYQLTGMANVMKKSLESKNKQQKLKGANMKILKNIGTKT